MTCVTSNISLGSHAKEAKHPLPALCACLVSGDAWRFWSKEEAHP